MSKEIKPVGPIALVTVESSLLLAVGYKPLARGLKRGTLRAVFKKNGEVYDYFEVEQSMYEEMLGAPSVGKFFINFIRDIYTFEKVIS